MLFVGHTRFSLFNPDSPSWKASNGSTFTDREQYKSHLYDPERLDLRTDIFVNQSLPQIALASKGHEVRHLVMYSESLPRKYQRALERAADEYPFLVLDCRSSDKPPTEPSHVAEQVLRHTQGDPQQAFGIYRLDDDDLLPVSYFDQMSAYVRLDNVGMQISLGEGMTALFIDGSFWNARKSYWPMFSAGLMNVCRFDDEGRLIGPKNAPHNTSDRTNPVILDSRAVGFFWTRHASQDTALAYGSHSVAEVMEQVLADMRRFPLLRDFGILHEEFPVLQGKVSLEPRPGMKRNVLVSEPTELDDRGVRLPVPNLSGQFELGIDIDCSPDAVPGNALFSLDLERADGTTLDPAQIKDLLAAQGVALSGNRAIGFFRYIHTAAGPNQVSYRVGLPEGVVCKEIWLRRWKKSDTVISLNSAALVSS